MAKQHQVGGPDLFAAGDFAERRLLARLRPVDLHRLHAGDAAVLADEFLGQHVELARVLAALGLPLGVRVVDAIDPRPLGPGIVRRALGRRAVEQLEVDHALAAVAERGADAVGPRVAAADHDHVEVLGGKVVAVGEVVVRAGSWCCG